MENDEHPRCLALLRKAASIDAMTETAGDLFTTLVCGPFLTTSVAVVVQGHPSTLTLTAIVADMME